MGTLTSTLSVKLLDDVSGPAGKAAGALRGLGGAGGDLKKLAAASPEAARLARELERLKAVAGKFDVFRGASRGLDDLGLNLRRARQDLAQADRLLARRQKTVAYFDRIKVENPARYQKWKMDGLTAGVAANLDRARRAQAKAAKAIAPAQAEFVEQGRHVRALRNELAGLGMPLKGMQSAETALRTSIEATNAALARQPELIARAARAAHARATAGADMVRGMGASGRTASARIEGGRRLAEGMGLPARTAAATRARTERETVEARAERRAELRAGKVALAGIAGVAVAHKVKEGTHATLDTYREFDKYKRQTEAFGNFGEDEMKSIVDMAIRGGASTRYNEIQWLQGAKALGGRGVKSGSVLGILPEAANYGQAMSTDLPEAVAGIEGSLFTFKRDLSTPEKATAAARRTADLQVGAAKSFGLTHTDLQGGYELGGLSAEMSGLGEEKLLAFLGLGKKLNIDGRAQGNAFNSMAGKYLSPTRKGREALAGVGVDYAKRQQMPDRLSVDNFSNMIAQQYGVKLDSGAREKLEIAFSDKDVFTNASTFAVKVKDALKDQVGISGAKDANKVAGSAERFRQNNVEKVDANGLLDDVMEAVKGGNLALANAIWGEKQGKRIMAALRDGDLWKKSVKQIEETPEGKAKGVAAKMNAGYDGAAARLEGSLKNLETALGRSWDDGGRGGFLTGLTDAAAKAAMALAELPQPVLAVGAAVTWLAGKAAGVAGTVALVGAAFSLKGSAAALTTAAARLGIGGTAGAAAAAAGTATTAAAGVAGGAAAGGVTAGGLVTAGVLAGGAVAGAALDAMTPGTNAGVSGLVTGSESSLQQTMRVLREERAADAAVQATGAPASWRQGPARALPGGADPGRGFPSVVPKSRGALGDFLLGQDKATVSLPQVSGLRASLGEIDTVLAATDAKLKALGTDTIAPKADTGPLDGLGTAAETTHGKLSALDAMSVAPKGDPSGLQAIESVVDRLISKLSGLGASIAATKAQAASIAVPSGAGGQGGGSTGAVRRAMANNFD